MSHTTRTAFGLTTYAAAVDTVATALTTMTADGCAPCKARAAELATMPPTIQPALTTTFIQPQSFSVNGSTVTLAPQTAGTPAPVATGTSATGRARWAGVIGVEGEMTGDGRLIEPNALRWENLPIPLRYVSEDSGAHDGAVVVGTIDTITRGAEGVIEATGTIDLTSDVGTEAARQVGEELTTGVSMDLDDVSFEIRVAAELMENDDILFFPFMAAHPLADDAMPGDAAEAPPDPMPESDADGRITVATVGSDDEVRVTTDGRIRAATIVAIPAFSRAHIHLEADTEAVLAKAPPFPPKKKDAPVAPADDTGSPTDGVMPDGTTECSCDDTDPAYDPDCDCSGSDTAPADDATPAKKAPPSPAKNAIVASAYPVYPPAAWFSNPNLHEPTALRVTDKGRVFGHLAAWHTCHISPQHTGCVQAPHSASGYAYFHTGVVVTAEGAEIPVGHLTLDTTHAGERMTPAQAAWHYENTGSVVADVVAGEDAHGIWVAGALRPNVTPTQLRALRSAPLSGDWRRIGTALELVAGLSVVVPGLPIPRPKGLVASGVVVSLVASGMLPPRRVIPPTDPSAFLSMDDLRYLKRLAARERAEEATITASGRLPAADDLARRVRATQLAIRARRRHL